MPDLDPIRQVKEKVEARLRQYPGVHAVGIGEKYVNGKPSGETAIVVLVSKKKPLDQLKTEDVVPTEMEGVKIDVIEVPMPRLDMSANPTNLTRTISPDARSITFAGKTNPGAGLLITVQYTGTPIATSPPAPGPPYFAAPYETGNYDTLTSIAQGVAKSIQDDGRIQGLSATSNVATVTATIPAGAALTITDVTITAIDDAQYFDKWVRGGIQLALGTRVNGSGTLGCLATTAVTSQDPQGKVVALTNHHVVRPDAKGTTNLAATWNPANSQIQLASKDGNPITDVTTDTVVAVHITTSSAEDAAYYRTNANDVFADVATGLSKAITSLGLSGVTTTPGASTLTVTGTTQMSVQVRGPLTTEGSVSAQVKVDTLTFQGTIDDDDYGIFVNIHPGNSPSFGVFVNPAKGKDADGMAKQVWEAFNNLPASVDKGSVTMPQPSGEELIVNHAELIEYFITNDIRVGQPDPSFGSSCCHCCSHRIGRVLDARLDLDAALIQLDPDIKYKPEIQDLGLVAGVEPPAINMWVRKRGRTMPVTAAQSAQIRLTNTSGVVYGTLRLYKNALLIQSMTRGRFGAPGDSGSAIVDESNTKVVGLHWGGYDIWSFATPMDRIVAAFPALQLTLNPAAAQGQAVDAVRTVPKPAAQMEAAPESLARATRPVMIGARLDERLREAEDEIVSVPAGKEYADLIRLHFNEGQQLVNRNRRVATAWHRNGGPELLQAILRIIQLRDERLPKELNGKPLTECLNRMLRVMARYASPRFSSDLRQHAPRLAGLAGLSFNDMLSMLQSWSGEQ